MFTKKTVFILGAGASWHYGYPTGEELVRKIILRSRDAANFFERSINPLNVQRPNFVFRNSPANLSTEGISAAWRNAAEEAKELATRLKQVNPLVIDYFLGQNPELRDIGRLLIAWVNLECEASYAKAQGNVNRREMFSRSPRREDKDAAKTISLQDFRDDWCRFVLHRLVENCVKSSDILGNAVHFVTFNYDVSLERALDQGLRSISMFKEEDIDKFLGADRICHVYGKVRDPSDRLDKINFGILSQKIDDQVRYQQNPNLMGIHLKEFLDAVYAMSRDIRVISPSDKELDMSAINSAKRVIKKAEFVYILGYGFDENNSKRLELFDYLRLASTGDASKARKAIMFTDYDDINRVNKKASMLFFGNSYTFLPNELPIKRDSSGQWYCEKSTRNVYDAFEKDFD